MPVVAVEALEWLEERGTSNWERSGERGRERGEGRERAWRPAVAAGGLRRLESSSPPFVDRNRDGCPSFDRDFNFFFVDSQWSWQIYYQKLATSLPISLFIGKMKVNWSRQRCYQVHPMSPPKNTKHGLLSTFRLVNPVLRRLSSSLLSSPLSNFLLPPLLLACPLAGVTVLWWPSEGLSPSSPSLPSFFFSFLLPHAGVLHFMLEPFW